MDDQGHATAWQATAKNFLIHHGTLVNVYKEKLCSTRFRRASKKIRHDGWMSSNSKVSLDEVKWLVWLFLGWTFWPNIRSTITPEKYIAAYCEVQYNKSPVEFGTGETMMPKNSSLMVRLDEESKALLASAAELRKVSVSDYVRSIVVSQARRERRRRGARDLDDRRRAA